MEVKTFTIDCTGYTVNADWYEAGVNNIVLALTGWSSNRKGYNDLLSVICAKTGQSALVFDYSGHGDSPFDKNKTRPAQHFLEVICVFDWLKEKYPSSKITVIGTSYGSFMATQLTKYRDFEKLILRAPAIYMPSDFYTLNGTINSPEAWKSNDNYRRNVKALSEHPLLARASQFKGKTLVVAHENDELIPKETSDAYANAFNAETYLAKDFPHSLINMPREQIRKYQEYICNWLIKN